MKKLLLLAGAACLIGCGGEPAPPGGQTVADMTPAADLVGVSDMTTIAPTKCAWAMTAPVAASGSADVATALLADQPQCVFTQGVIDLKTKRPDGRIDELALDVNAPSVGTNLATARVQYRLLVPGQATPLITCQNWTGSAALASELPNLHVVVNMGCAEVNAGWVNWQLDMGAPNTNIVGSITLSP